MTTTRDETDTALDVERAEADKAQADLKAQVDAANAEIADLRKQLEEAQQPPPQPQPPATQGRTAPIRGVFPIPPVGSMYLGAAVEGFTPSKMNTMETNYGIKTLGMWRFYFTPGQAANVANLIAEPCKAALANGSIPVASTKVPGGGPNSGWTDCANGKQDTWLDNIQKAVATVPGPVLFCLHHEPTGNGDPKEWVRMYEHAAPILHRAKNLIICPIINGYQLGAGNPTPEYRVPSRDVTGVDLYAFGNDIEYTAKQIVDRHATALAQLSTWPDIADKPIVHCEWGWKRSWSLDGLKSVFPALYDLWRNHKYAAAFSYWNASTAGDFRLADPVTAAGDPKAAVFTGLCNKATSVQLAGLG